MRIAQQFHNQLQCRERPSSGRAVRLSPIIPCSMAQTATCARDLRPSLLRIFATWRSAVDGAITSAFAISRLQCPFAMSKTTSCWRRLRRLELHAAATACRIASTSMSLLRAGLLHGRSACYSMRSAVAKLRSARRRSPHSDCSWPGAQCPQTAWTAISTWLSSTVPISGRHRRLRFV